PDSPDWTRSGDPGTARCSTTGRRDASSGLHDRGRTPASRRGARWPRGRPGCGGSRPGEVRRLAGWPWRVSLYRTLTGEALFEDPLERLEMLLVSPERAGQLVDDLFVLLQGRLFRSSRRAELRGGLRQPAEAALERAADHCADRRDVHFPESGHDRRAHGPHPLWSAARRTQSLRLARGVEQEVSLDERLHRALDPLAQEEGLHNAAQDLAHAPAHRPRRPSEDTRPFVRAGQEPDLVFRKPEAPALSELPHHPPPDPGDRLLFDEGDRNQG